MKKSEHLKAEESFVERDLGGRIICESCHATLQSYASFCTADLGESCHGFQAIEASRLRFKDRNAHLGTGR